MKKQLLTYLVFLLLAINARAQQSTTVTIGTGTVTSPDNGPIYISHNAGQHTSKHAAIYLASEIKATTFSGRALTQIAWNKTDTSRYTTNNGVLKIYVKNTTASALPASNWGDLIYANELAGATLVYSNSTQNISSGAGWKNFTLNTPFFWNGTDNLEVIIDWSMPGASTGTKPMEWATTTPLSSNLSAFLADPWMPGPYIYTTTNRPNAQLTFTAYTNDAGVSAITAPASLISPGASPVQAIVKNNGTNLLSTATIGWKVNGVAQPDKTLPGTLAAGQTTAPLLLGSFNFPLGTSTIKAYTKNPNGVNDAFTGNDTTSLKLVACNTLSGNYTINKNAPVSATNVRSFTEAAQILNSCGINGPVTFTVAPGTGPYNERLELKNVSGVSATNTITFEGNGNTLRTELIDTNIGTAAILIDNVKYVKLNNLVVSTYFTNYTSVGYGIQFMNQSNNATVSNCTINMPTDDGQFLMGLLIGGPQNAPGDNSSNSLFQNNTITGGGFSMRINGKSVTGSAPIGGANNRVIGNQFKDFQYGGMYITNADGTIIEGNDFTRPTRAIGTSFTGIDLVSGRNTVINKNRFHNTHGGLTSKTGGVTGVQIQQSAAAGAENIVKNNLFYDLNNTGNITVLNTYSATTDWVSFYNNTISIENPARTATTGGILKAFNLAGPGANIKFINNIVSINCLGNGIKAAIYYQNFNSSTDPIAATFQSNNNAFYIAPGQTTAYVGYIPTPTPLKTAATLAAWQAINTATPYDVNSVEANPVFINLATGNLKPTASAINNKGQALTAVTDDILGAARNTTTPDPGAYEFDLGSNDAGITAIVSPTSPAQPGVSTPVTVTLKNMGTANLTTATIGWKVNGVRQPDYSWTGTVATNATAPVTLGNYTFAAGAYTVCAWTQNPNAGTDANAANDSTCATINACAPLAGNYTINKILPASATNFTSFSAATAALHNCGVSAKVTISVAAASGPYTEQVDLLNIPGVSATNRVIFQGNGNTLTAAPNAQKATVLALNNADYVKINNLTVALTGTVSASTPPYSAIQMLNNSDNDTISNCTVNMPLTNGPNVFAVGIFAGLPGSTSGLPNLDTPGNFTNNSVFMNNTINGGHSGIVINGNPGGINAVNNRVIGNVIQDSYEAGIALSNADGSLVEQNEMKRPTYTNAGAFYGIKLGVLNGNDGSKNTMIRKNRIHHLWANQLASANFRSYGIYCASVSAAVGSENLVSNNVFYDTYSGHAYGITNNASSGIHYYHNTINIENNGTSVGYSQIMASSNVKFNNNIVSINSTGPGDKNALSFNNTGTIESNNNAFYIDPSNNNINVAKHAITSGTTNYATLAAWQAALVQDMQSEYAKPFYKNVATGDFTPTSAFINNIGKPLAAVTTDITGAPRNATTPDPGAYEFTPLADDTGVLAIITPNSGCGLTSQETVSTTIKNFGAATKTSIPVSFQVDNGAIITEMFTGSLPLGSTANFTFKTKADLSAPGAHTIIAKTILPNDGIAANDAKTVTINNATQAALPAGIDFETAATGISTLRTVTNPKSNITDGAGASNPKPGIPSTKGMLMDGVDTATWVSPTGGIDPWTTNADHFSAAYMCVSTAGGAATDSLLLTFDLKQLWKTANSNTNFRVTVNGTAVGGNQGASPANTYRPPFNGIGGTTNWTRVKIDLSAYLTQPSIQIGLESSVSAAYANGTGTANLIDNIGLVRIAGPTGPSGVKDNSLQGKVAVYPNPSNGLFQITLPKGKAYELTVTDLTGKVLKKQAASAGTSQLNLTGTAKGIYLLRVSGENGSAVRKLIVE